MVRPLFVLSVLGLTGLSGLPGLIGPASAGDTVADCGRFFLKYNPDTKQMECVGAKRKRAARARPVSTIARDLQRSVRSLQSAVGQAEQLLQRDTLSQDAEGRVRALLSEAEARVREVRQRTRELATAQRSRANELAQQQRQIVEAQAQLARELEQKQRALTQQLLSAQRSRTQELLR